MKVAGGKREETCELGIKKVAFDNQKKNSAALTVLQKDQTTSRILNAAELKVLIEWNNCTRDPKMP